MHRNARMPQDDGETALGLGQLGNVEGQTGSLRDELSGVCASIVKVREDINQLLSTALPFEESKGCSCVLLRIVRLYDLQR